MFKVGDKVIADGDQATVTQVLQGADSDWGKTVSYVVVWPETDEWGTFTEDELQGVN